MYEPSALTVTASVEQPLLAALPSPQYCGPLSEKIAKLIAKSTGSVIASNSAVTAIASTPSKSAGVMSLSTSSPQGLLTLTLTLPVSTLALPLPASVTSVASYALRSTEFPPCSLSDSTTRRGLPSLSRSVKALNVKSSVIQF